MKRWSISSRRGQSLVEFALALPILLLLTVFIFDVGRVVYFSSAIHNAAREGARYGIIHPNDAPGMENAATEYAIGLGLADFDVIAGPGPTQYVGGAVNYTVLVTVTYTFRPATPFIAKLFFGGSGTISLVGDAVMRTETRPSS